METKGNALEYLDLVIQPFAESVGFSVFPAVLDVTAPVPYGAGGGVDFFHFGSCVLMDPFGQVFLLDGVRKGHQDLVEELQGIVSLQQIRGKCKGIAEPLEIFVVERSPVFLLVDLFGLQKTGNTLDFSEVCHVAGILELVLIAEADLIHHVIEPFDDVERIDTDPGIGEILFCNGDEAVAHVTAEVFYLLALRWRELMEISIDSDAGDLVQDVDDGVSIAVRNTAVELIEIPSVAPGTPDAGVALEFIDADGLGKLSRQSELDGLKNRLDGALRNAVAPGDFGEGDGFCEIQKDGIVESLCHVQGRMNPVGILIESRATFFAVGPAFVKGNRRAPVIGRDVSYGLPDAGILDDAVGGAAVRTEPLPWSWDIQGNEIIVSECLDAFDGCFLGKLC